jgi:hypothetical protein
MLDVSGIRLDLLEVIGVHGHTCFPNTLPIPVMRCAKSKSPVITATYSSLKARTANPVNMANLTNIRGANFC